MRNKGQQGKEQGSSSSRRREQQKCHLFVNLPTQHQICEVNKTKGRLQQSQTAQVSETEAEAVELELSPWQRAPQAFLSYLFLGLYNPVLPTWIRAGV